MPREKTAQINLRLRPALKKLAERQAKKRGRSVNSYLETLILEDAREAKTNAHS